MWTLPWGILGRGLAASANPHPLVNAYITREAVVSSLIEGTQASGN